MTSDEELGLVQHITAEAVRRCIEVAVEEGAPERRFVCAWPVGPAVEHGWNVSLYDDATGVRRAIETPHVPRGARVHPGINALLDAPAVGGQIRVILIGHEGAIWKMFPVTERSQPRVSAPGGSA